MVGDHIHQMFYYAADFTILNMLGRMALPLFLFMCAEGFYHTRSKTRYSLRLYIAGALMIIATDIISSVFPIHVHSVVLMNNIFMTMFLATIAMRAVDLIREKKVAKGILLFSLPIFSSLLPFLCAQNPFLIQLAFFIPSYLMVEANIVAIILVLCFYIFREKRTIQCLCLIIVSFITAVAVPDFSIMGLFNGQNYQWMMVFAIFLISLYNGKRGKGSKYFFYIFYPAHIYGLYLLAYYLLQSGIV